MVDRPPRLVSDIAATAEVADQEESDAADIATVGAAPRPVRRLVRVCRLLAWAATSLMGLVALTQAAGSTPVSLIYVLQALTPMLLAPAFPLAAVAAWRRWWPLAGVNAVIAVALVLLVLPVVDHDTPPDVPAGAPVVRVAFANTYLDNRDPEAAATALLALDADLIGIAEYSPDVERALQAAGAFDGYPYRVGFSSWGRDGIVLYSRERIVSQRTAVRWTSPAVDAVVTVGGADVRVLVIHAKAGVNDRELDDWSIDLEAVHDEIVDADMPTVVLGDFNASRWHPDFRDVLHDTDFHDVHEWLGAGFSRPWPNDLPIPPFVRIDHALVYGLVPTDVTDLDVPGSDHRGFVTTLAVVPRS